jgi:hypothetical protein
VTFRSCSICAPALALVVGLAAAIATPAAAASAASGESPWAPGKQWLSVRAGYANSTVSGSGDAGGGFGFGYARILRSVKLAGKPLLGGWSLGGYVHYEVLGKLGNASEIAVPATVELAKQFHWNSDYRPYLGMGAGAYYHMTYNTGADNRSVDPGFYVVFGANTTVTSKQVLGIDVRLTRVEMVNDPPNPVFGAGSADVVQDANGSHLEKHVGTQWSVKLNWAVAY